MKKMGVIYEFLRKDMQLYIFFALMLFMPMTKAYLPILMGLWVLTGMLVVKRKVLDIHEAKLWLLIAPLVFYFLHVVSVFYSDDKGAAWFDLEVKLSILFLPIVSYFLSERVQINREKLLFVFVIANVIISIVCIGVAIKKSFVLSESGNWEWMPAYWTGFEDLSFFELIKIRVSKFSYGFLSFILHPAYFSMYILLSISILVYFVISKKGTPKKTVIYLLLIIYLLAFVWLLGSRAGFLSLIGLAFFIGSIYLFRLKKRWLSFIIALAILTGGSLLINNSALKNNFSEFYAFFIDTNKVAKNEDMRINLWQVGLSISKENGLWGVGAGDVKDELLLEYNARGMEYELENNYNIHNQFLESLVGIGFIGCFILIIWFFGTLVYGIIKGKFLLTSLMIILIVNAFFESILNKSVGIAFLVVFYSLLINERKLTPSSTPLPNS